MSATNDTVPLDPEAEKKRKRREADAAKKAEAEVEAKIEDASVTAERAQLDLELLSIESAGYCLVDEPNLPESGSAETPEALVKTIEDAAAKARSAYAERWTVRSRDHAGWAARKILEAREHLDEVKRWAKTEVARADRQFEGRKAFFDEKLLVWAIPEPKERGTKGSIRLPAHGVRVEVRDVELGGTRILDERALAAELVEKLGISECMELGLVRLEPVLCPTEAKAWIEKTNTSCVNAVVEERAIGKQLRIAGLGK